MSDDKNGGGIYDGVKGRAVRVINAAEMRTWITQPREGGLNWRDIVRRTLAIYEARNGIREEYEIVDEHDCPVSRGIRIESLRHAEDLREALAKNYTARRLSVARRLVGKWSRVV